MRGDVRGDASGQREGARQGCFYSSRTLLHVVGDQEDDVEDEPEDRHGHQDVEPEERAGRQVRGRGEQGEAKDLGDPRQQLRNARARERGLGRDGREDGQASETGKWQRRAHPVSSLDWTYPRDDVRLAIPRS